MKKLTNSHLILAAFLTSVFIVVWLVGTEWSQAVLANEDFSRLDNIYSALKTLDQIHYAAQRVDDIRLGSVMSIRHELPADVEHSVRSLLYGNHSANSPRIRDRCQERGGLLNYLQLVKGIYDSSTRSTTCGA